MVGVASDVGSPSAWGKIVSTRNELEKIDISFSSSFHKKVGSGHDTRFWTKIWCSNTPFSEKYARLFALEINQSFHVNQKLVGLDSCHSWVLWTWRRPIRSGREETEFNDLQHEISSIILSSNQGSWRWSLHPSGEFSVSSFRAIIDSKLLGQLGSKLRWNNLVPGKINILAWRIQSYRLPTRANIDKRGIDLHSILCPFCEEQTEDENHLFALCPFSRNI
ncbi:RNA-directed DNA polymerase, eukaryota, reverse transcriptase zinc-binding domain protein [Tanacetum coccineum]